MQGQEKKARRKNKMVAGMKESKRRALSVLHLLQELFESEYVFWWNKGQMLVNGDSSGSPASHWRAPTPY